MIKIINYFIKIYELLFTKHFNEWLKKSIENALVILSEKIHKMWKNEKIFTVIFINIINAFNNIYYKRLIYNLWTKRIFQSIIK